MRRALLLVGQLRTHPDSRFRLAEQGEVIGPWHWPAPQRILADLFDLQATFFAGIAGEKLPEDDLYPRPHIAEPVEEEHIPTIAEFDVDSFMRQINS